VAPRRRPPRGRSYARAALAALLLATAPVAALGQGSIADAKARLEEIEAELNAVTARVQRLDGAEHELEHRIGSARARIARAQERMRALQHQAVARADALYRSGGTQMIEALFTAETFTELSDKAELMSRISIEDAAVFVKLSRTKLELEQLTRQLEEDSQALNAVQKELAAEVARLQAHFDSVQDEYQRLLDELAAQQADSAPAAQLASSGRTASGMACPVDGPRSFINDWGFPRSGGRTHQGTDIMAPAGTPVVAIVAGTVQDMGYGSSAGYWQILYGDDGNSYWYLHNSQNLRSGRVSAGQQIATVGNTGNASGGPPHLHFEYHPGGGGPANPYPLLVTIC
jgi:murein DD-endopeptidase MepM/ murein hydrolase activator NlpD